ncbi:transposase, partial [Klebsiella aerogenes]|uniref:transposase n=1 Tax=Klebsiella aerogenes TaxID=548 RepID=UPI001E439EF3
MAADLTQDANDLRQLAPILSQTEQNTGWLPEHVSADTGYFNLQQMDDARFKSVEFYIPPRAKGPKESDSTKSERMREKLETDIGRVLYA